MLYDQPNLYYYNSSYDNTLITDSAKVRLMMMMIMMMLMIMMMMMMIITVCLRLESLCKSDSAKVRLRLGTSASSFSLNSSLVPGTLFNCHLELALDSSKLGEQVSLS